MLPDSPAHSAAETGAPALAPFVQLATVLHGVQPLAEKGINDSFRGQLVLSDGTTRSAIIKDLDPRQLANELMVAALAHAAGMPIPGALLARVPEGSMTARKGPTTADGERLVFGSVDVQTPPVIQWYKGKDASTQKKICERLAEWPDIGALYGFDTWVANIDRHMGNLLFSGDKEVWLIDHGHCFTGPKWTAAALDSAGDYKNKLRSWLTPCMSDSDRALSANAAGKMPDRVKGLDLNKVGELNHVVDILDRQDFDAVVTFLSNRTAHVPALAANALGWVV